MYFLSQDALSLLAENAELIEENGRGVAFRRAAAVMKALPRAVTDVTQLRGLPCLGEHSRRVIKVSRNMALLFRYRSFNKSVSVLLQDILENRASSEVEATKQSERYKALKVSGRCCFDTRLCSKTLVE